MYEELEVVNRGVNLIVDDTAEIPSVVSPFNSFTGIAKGVKRAKIECSIDGKDKFLKVTDAGGWEMAGVVDADGKVAHCAHHPLEVNPGCGGVDVNVTSSQTYDDHGLSWNTKPARVGLSGPFSYQP